jgi:phosphate transport system permease protein
VLRSLREAGYALSATKLEVSTRIVFPAAMSGVVAAVLLGLARAVGETMAVTLAAGMTPNLTLNPFVSVQTLTAYMVQVSQGDTPAGTIEYQTILAVGITLFLITLAINLVATRVVYQLSLQPVSAGKGRHQACIVRHALADRDHRAGGRPHRHRGGRCCFGHA